MAEGLAAKFFWGRFCGPLIFQIDLSYLLLPGRVRFERFAISAYFYLRVQALQTT